MNEYMNRDAKISPDGLYRYTLTRSWSGGRRCVFVMLNPSTADGIDDDPTIRRCIDFAKREQCGSLLVVNLYAFRATDPEELKDQNALRGQTAVVGPENMAVIERELDNPGDLVIAAWGTKDFLKRAGKFLWAFRNRPIYALSITKAGHPKHPLYIKGDAPLQPYNDAAREAGPATKLGLEGEGDV